MKKLARLCTMKSTAERPASVDWSVEGECNGKKIADGGMPYDRSRQTYHWFETNHALVKNRAAANTGDNAKCVCGKAEEAQWHVLSTCKATITQLFDGDTQKEESDDGKA